MNTDALSRLNQAGTRTIGRALAGAVVGGLLIASLEFAATREAVAGAVGDQLVWLARLAVHWILAAVPVGLAIAVVELLAGNRQPSGPCYALGVTLGVGSGALILALHGRFIDPAISETAVGFDMEMADRFLYGFWLLLFWGSVGAVLHASSLRERHALIAFHSAELARLRSIRALAEARLSALNAQVEPEFVVTALNTVERLYKRDTEAADHVLDALIRSLRRATPLLRAKSSTLVQECSLLEACAQAIGDAAGVKHAVHFEIDERAGSIPMPPGSLLSLVQTLLRKLPAPAEAGRVSIDVHVASTVRGASISFSVLGAVLDDVALQELTGRFLSRLNVANVRSPALEVRRNPTPGLTLRIELCMEENQG